MWERFSYSEIFPARFQPEECQQIVKYHEILPATTSKFVRGDGAPLRDSGIYWLYRNADTAWVFDRLGGALREYNQNYRYEIDLTIGSAQLTRYSVGQQYGWHVDVGWNEMSRRKVSMVLELSDPNDHVGGGLEVFHDHELNNKLPLRQGDIAMFSSFTPHRATPVQQGERWSLVCWILGDQPLR